ncbi:unnamed protein product [Rhizoctonia solani]|uniref:Uncharacterized protein n=1 Tax=Rhizoctonia solani TaxID=456999 RepID=A0A8H3ART6_9AGAM|nr:unnamed protein product [Rhizoctonia solani]
MIGSLTQSNSTTIQKWEGAGAVLLDALSKYLDLCGSLKTTLLQQDSNPLDLAGQIDSALGSLHVTLDQQFALSRATLARTRNELVSPLYHLPEELLSDIFMNVVFSNDVWTSRGDCGPLSMEDSLTMMQRHLYSLLHTCSMWRSVILNRNVFCSIVGTYKVWSRGSQYPTNANLPIRGTKEGSLNLAVALRLPGDFDWGALRNHAHRFRSINIAGGIHHPTLSKDIIDVFLENIPSQLSELSIRHATAKEWSQSFVPSEGQYIIPHSSSDWAPFLEIVKSLSILRISGDAFSLRHMVFSNRLVELRLQSVTIGLDSEFSEFLNVLSSASELRELKLISVITIRDLIVPRGTVREKQHTTLPKLQSLFLEDLYSNTLDLFSQWLTPASCRLSLYLTDSSTEEISNNFQPSPVDTERLCSILRPIAVDTLVLFGSSQLAINMLRRLLESMPTLKNLKFDSWLGPEGRDALKRPEPQTASVESDSGVFPKLEQLYLTSLWVEDGYEEALKDVVASHPIRKMVLGDIILVGSGERAKLLDDGEPICEWLRSTVSDFHLETARPPEFYSSIWQLW